MARVAWRLAVAGLLTAAVVLAVGGALAALLDTRSASDRVVVAGFALLVLSLPLAWIGLPAAAAAPDPELDSPLERNSP